MKYKLNDYIKAGLKLIGRTSTRYVWIPLMGIVEVDRCMTCGGLVLSTQDSLRLHPGHRMQAPCKIGIFELIFLWIRKK